MKLKKYKYWEILIDDFLSFTSHIQQLVQKITQGKTWFILWNQIKFYFLRIKNLICYFYVC